MKSNKIIIGVAGFIASGKGTVGEYICKKYKGEVFSSGGILRDMVDRLHIEPTRDNLQKMSLALRDTYGPDILSQTLAKEVLSSKKTIIAIEGLRRPSDVDALRTMPNFHLFAVDAPIRTRWQRMRLRRQKSDDAKKTFKEFLHDSAAEAERQIGDIMKQAELILDNSGSFEKLFKQIDKAIKKIQYECKNKKSR